jgi:hypothetical protein
MGSMGIRGYKVGRVWSRLLVIALTVIIATPMASGMFAGEMDRVADDKPAAPNPIPKLSQSIYPTQLQAEVTQSQLGKVTFGGNATVEQMMFMDSTVTLTAVVNTGWPVILNPQTMKFKGPGTQRFTLSIIVPPATSSLVTGNVIVSGACKAPGLSPVVASAGAVVTIKQYFKIRVESSEPSATVKSGETAKIEIEIYNDGNGPATFRLTIPDPPKDIQIEFENTEFNVQAQEFTIVSIRAKPSARASAGEHDIGIRVEVFNGPGEGGASTTFNITTVVTTLTSEIGYPTIVAIIFVAGVAVAVAVLWRTGKLKGLKLPKRIKTDT